MRHDPITNLPLDQIVFDSELRFRGFDTAQLPRHVDDLSRALRNAGKLDPITVWKEQDEKGTETGRLVLLDGYFRMQAYRDTSGPRSGIPCRFFEGSRQQAEVFALAANSKAQRSMSKRECVDAAWVLTWRHGHTVSKRKLACGAGVSQRTIANMRAQKKKIEAAGKHDEAFTGGWQRDKLWPKTSPYEPLTDQERLRNIEELTTCLQEALRKQRPRDTEVQAEALLKAIGDSELQIIFDYLYGVHEDDLYGTEDREYLTLLRRRPLVEPANPDDDF
jgi:hypothetical protein